MNPLKARSRVLTVARAWLGGEWMGESGTRLPFGAVLIHASIAAALCLAVRTELGVFAYGVVALSIPMALTTLPLLGELAPLLRADPAEEWIAAQPVRPPELRAARILCIAVLLGGLALSSLLPAALCAPAAMSWGERLILILVGLAQTMSVAAALLWVQALFGNRAESALVLVQTALLCALLIGTILGLRNLPVLAAIDAPTGALLFYPPAVFAVFLVDSPFRAVPVAATAALALTTAAALTLALAPFPPPLRARRTGSALSVLLSPLRALATRLWVRKTERASFDFIYDALPAERDFVMRAYPLLAIPLAFLLLGSDADATRTEGLLALLMFTPAIYLSVLLVHVPATATPEARWLLDTAPLDPDAEREGAIKAIAVRFLTPLFVLLIAACIARGSLDLALRIAPAAIVAGMVTLRIAWRSSVTAAPLSLKVQDLPAAYADGFSGPFMALAIGHTLLAILCWRLIQTPWQGFLVLAAGVSFELLLSRAARPSRETPASPPPTG